MISASFGRVSGFIRTGGSGECSSIASKMSAAINAAP
jgi:hypothetical protein